MRFEPLSRGIPILGERSGSHCAGAQLLQFYFSLSQLLRGFDLHSSNDLAALNSLFLEVNKLRVIAFQIYSSRGSYYADQGLKVTELD